MLQRVLRAGGTALQPRGTACTLLPERKDAAGDGRAPGGLAMARGKDIFGIAVETSRYAMTASLHIGDGRQAPGVSEAIPSHSALRCGHHMAVIAIECRRYCI